MSDIGTLKNPFDVNALWENLLSKNFPKFVILSSYITHNKKNKLKNIYRTQLAMINISHQTKPQTNTSSEQEQLIYGREIEQSNEE